MLQRIYTRILSLASHPRAPWALVGLSFAESSFSPIPPDPLLIPMCLTKPKNAWQIASICTAASVLGGLFGYWLGFALFEHWGMAIIGFYGLEDKFMTLMGNFRLYAFWIIAAKALTPIPFKLVTIASGVAHVDLLTFVVASTIARGFRFFLLAGLAKKFGATVHEHIVKNLTLLTVAGTSVLAFGFVIIKYL